MDQLRKKVTHFEFWEDGVIAPAFGKTVASNNTSKAHALPLWEVNFLPGYLKK